MKFANIRSRTVTAAILVAVIGLAILGGPLSLLALALIINYLALAEYNKLTRLLGYMPQLAAMQVAGSLLIILAWLAAFGRTSPLILALLLPLPAIICLVELLRRSRQPFTNIAFTLLSVLWISLPLAAFSAIGSTTLSVHYAGLYTGYFMLLWAGDSGAYFAGSQLGKHPLLSRISPKKTIEGSIGGLLAAILASLMNAALFPVLLLRHWFLLAILVNLTGTLGDLVKSMLKRSAGVKDSGNLLPGHGGVIDRFDSLFGSAPFVFLYLTFYA